MFMSSEFMLQHAFFRNSTTCDLLQVNEDIHCHDLRLTPSDAKMIMTSRKKTLSHYGRIELSLNITKAIATQLASFSSISPDHYVDHIIELQEIFYYLKNETEDKISDDRMLKLLAELYDTLCHGSLDALRDHAENYARDFRKRMAQNNKPIGGFTHDEK